MVLTLLAVVGDSAIVPPSLYSVEHCQELTILPQGTHDRVTCFTITLYNV